MTDCSSLAEPGLGEPLISYLEGQWCRRKFWSARALQESFEMTFLMISGKFLVSFSAKFWMTFFPFLARYKKLLERSIRVVMI